MASAIVWLPQSDRPGRPTVQVALEDSVFWRSRQTAALAGHRTGFEQPRGHCRQREWPERLPPVCQEEL